MREGESERVCAQIFMMPAGLSVCGRHNKESERCLFCRAREACVWPYTETFIMIRGYGYGFTRGAEGLKVWGEGFEINSSTRRVKGTYLWFRSGLLFRFRV